MILNKSSVDRGLCHGQIYQVCSCCNFIWCITKKLSSQEISALVPYYIFSQLTVSSHKLLSLIL